MPEAPDWRNTDAKASETPGTRPWKAKESEAAGPKMPSRRFRRRAIILTCVIGLAIGPLEAIAANNDIHIANHNTSRHFLLAGERVRVEAEEPDDGRGDLSRLDPPVVDRVVDAGPGDHQLNVAETTVAGLRAS